MEEVEAKDEEEEGKESVEHKNVRPDGSNLRATLERRTVKNSALCMQLARRCPTSKGQTLRREGGVDLVPSLFFLTRSLSFVFLYTTLHSLKVWVASALRIHPRRKKKQNKNEPQNSYIRCACVWPNMKPRVSIGPDPLHGLLTT